MIEFYLFNKAFDSAVTAGEETVYSISSGTMMLMAAVAAIVVAAFVFMGISKIYSGIRADKKDYSEGERTYVATLPNRGREIGYIGVIRTENLCPRCSFEFDMHDPKYCPECGHGFREESS